MAEETQGSQNIQADNNSIAFGGISVGGNVEDIRIGHTIGYTSEQVSTLITQISTTFQPKPFDGRCPYKGLDVFEEEDAELFFGREKLVEDLLVRVKESRTVFVTGPSGSGKSSLVRAGLIHALKQGTIKESNSERWLYATIKPGRDPFEAMAGAFSRLKSPELGDYFLQNGSRPDVLHKCAESTLSERSDQRLVLFIDQFEEIFTQIHKDRAQAFVELLAHVADAENGRVILLFAMRSDFIPNCVIYPRLNALLNRQFVQIGAMQADELVSAIAQPALRVGLRIDPDLIAQIINDMHGEPGALPLMQFALKDLFDSQQAKGGLIALTLSDYLKRGGIRKALERHADKTFAGLSNEEQELARSIFTGLIEIGRGTQDTRRTAIFDELVPASASSASVEAIVAKLADARLITTDEVAGKDTVTISHEKLIDAWPWLIKLVNENRDVIALQNEIAEDAKEWEEHGRDPSYLYSGARLSTAREKMTAQKFVLSGTAFEYIRAGQVRKRREQIILIGSVSIVFVLLVIAVVTFASLTREAENRAINAQALQLGFQNKSLLDAGKTIQAYRLKFMAENALDNVPKSQLSMDILNNPTLTLAVSPNGQYLATRLPDQIVVWDAKDLSGDPTVLRGVTNAIAFAPDSKTLVSAEYDARIIFWDIESQSSVAELPVYDPYFMLLSFAPDGNLLVAGSGAGTFLVINTSDPRNPSIVAEFFAGTGVASIAISPDGKTLATVNQLGGIVLWDTSQWSFNMLEWPEISAICRDLGFSPDQKELVVITERYILIYDSNNDFGNDPITLELDDSVQSAFSDMKFSPDGTQLAVGRYDGVIQIWDMNNLNDPPHIIESTKDFSEIEWLH